MVQGSDETGGKEAEVNDISRRKPPAEFLEPSRVVTRKVVPVTSSATKNMSHSSLEGVVVVGEMVDTASCGLITRTGDDGLCSSRETVGEDGKWKERGAGKYQVRSELQVKD